MHGRKCLTAFSFCENYFLTDTVIRTGIQRITKESLSIVILLRVQSRHPEEKKVKGEVGFRLNRTC